MKPILVHTCINRRNTTVSMTQKKLTVCLK